ncbi:MAG: 50S ribosomal protein L24 [Candidatus Anstonellales archaeon]
MMPSSHISKALRKKLGARKRSISVRKGDRVKVMRGEYKGKEGTVAKVNSKAGKVYIEGITVKNARGKEVLVPFDASNLLLTELVMSDERKRRLSR